MFSSTDRAGVQANVCWLRACGSHVRPLSTQATEIESTPRTSIDTDASIDTHASIDTDADTAARTNTDAQATEQAERLKL